jgi:hypothetical protein
MKKAERNRRQRIERERDHAMLLLVNAKTKGNDKQVQKWTSAIAVATELLAEMSHGRRFDALTGVVHSVDPDTGEDV